MIFPMTAYNSYDIMKTYYEALVCLPVHRQQMLLGMHAQSNVMKEVEDMKPDLGDEQGVETCTVEDDLLAPDWFGDHATWLLQNTTSLEMYAHKREYLYYDILYIFTQFIILNFVLFRSSLTI